MTLAELGAKLKEARIGRSMTVDDVIDRLKIPTRVLTGIEEGDAQLPRTIYVFHYIKDYARILGFSAEEIRSMTEDLEGFDAVRQPVREANMPYTPVHPSAAPRILGTAFRLVLALAIGYGGYVAYRHFLADPGSALYNAQQTSQKTEAQRGENAPAWNVPANTAATADKADRQEHKIHVAEPLAAVNGAAAPEKKADESPAQPQAVQAPATASLPPAAQPSSMPPQPAPDWNAPAAPQPDPTFVTPAVAQNPGTAAPSAHQAYILGQDKPVENRAAMPSADAPALPENGHQVVLTADKGDCWIGYEQDGKKLQRNLRRGDSFTVSFNDGLRLRLGNAAAVNVNYDGRDMERSASSRPLNMTFPPAE